MVLAVLGLIAAAGCDGGGNDTPEYKGIDASDPACVYELTDADSGMVTAGKEFPTGLYPSEYRKLGSGLSITLVDPLDESRPLTLTVPQCIKDAALTIIEARQQSNREQEDAGIPFDQRIFE